MTTKNQHIEDFIDYYYNLDVEPGYAVLIKGNWGTGKTWFIKKTLSKYKEEKRDKYLYVSLNGMTSFDEIDDEFFKQLHPVLSSKSMNITGKIVKGLLKASLKIDLGTHQSTTISSQIPDVKIPDFLKDTSELIIIFDDLERASIPLDSLMGYINHFVEQQGRKVIIIGNEDEILSREGDLENDGDNITSSAGKENKKSTDYRRIKEKLIGKTFEVSPQFEDAYENFIQEMQSYHSKTFYTSNLDLISQIYNQSEYKNLRHLKQALWDFERLISHFEYEYLEKEELLSHLLKLFLIFSFEIKSGNLKAKEISKFSELQILIYKASTEKEKIGDKVYGIYQRYKSEIFFNLIFEYDTWIEILDKGIINKEEINKSIRESNYFMVSVRPDWLNAYFVSDVTQSEFEDAIKSIERDITTHQINEIGVLMHILGIYLFLSDQGLITKSKTEIVQEIQDYIDYMDSKGCLINKTLVDHPYIDSDSWGGYGFRERDTDEFKTVRIFLDKKIKSSIEQSYPEVALALLQLMKENAQEFYRSMSFRNNTENNYYKTPIFSHLTPQDFVNAFQNTPINMRKYVGFTFSNRYKEPLFANFLLTEYDFLKEVITLLNSLQKSNQGKVLGLQLRDIIEYHFQVGIEYLTCLIDKEKDNSCNNEGN